MQLLTFSNVPTYGYFALSDGTNTTPPIPFSATASDVETSLADAAPAAIFNDGVTGDFAGGFVIEGAAALTVSTMPAAPADAVSVTETQAGSAPPSCTLTVSEITAGADAGQTSMIIDASSCSIGSYYIQGSPTSYSPDNPYAIAVTGGTDPAAASGPQSAMDSTFGAGAATATSFDGVTPDKWLIVFNGSNGTAPFYGGDPQVTTNATDGTPSVTGTNGSAAAAEVMQISIDNAPTAGQYTIGSDTCNFDDSTTGGAVTAQTAFDDLFGAGVVTASGGPLSSGPITATWTATGVPALWLSDSTANFGTPNVLNASLTYGTGQDEIQQLTILGEVSGGTFNLTLPDSTFLGLLDYNISDATLQGFITGLSSYTSATVTSLAIDYGVQASLSLATVDGSGLVIEPLSFGGFTVDVIETQAGIPGTFTLTANRDATPGDGMPFGTWTVGDWSGGGLATPTPSGWSASGPLFDPSTLFALPIVFTWLSGSDAELSWNDSSLGDGIGGFMISDNGSYQAQDEIQTISIPSAVDFGTFSLTLPDSTSFTLPWDASSADFQTAVQVNSSYTSATVSGGNPSWTLDYGVQTSLALASGNGDAELEPVTAEIALVGLAAAASNVQSAMGTLTIGQQLAAAAINVQSALGTLTVEQQLGATAINAQLALGTLTVGQQLSATAINAQSAAATISPATLQGVATNVQSVQAGLAVGQQLAAVASNAQSAIGAVMVGQQLAATAINAQWVGGALTIGQQLSAALSNVQVASGLLTVQRKSRYQPSVVGMVRVHGLEAGMVTA